MLRTHSDGTLDIRSVDELARQTPDALSEWIENRLHNVDVWAPDDPKQDIGQYYLVGAIYPQLAPSTQREVRAVLRGLLLRLEARDPTLEDRPGDDLLALVMDIGEPELSEPIGRMAETERFLTADPPDADRHARLVQALAGLGVTWKHPLWAREARRDPERYLALAFAGVRNSSAYRALDLLAAFDPLSEELEFKLRPSVRGLLRRRGLSRDALRAMVDNSQTLPGSVRAYLRRVLPELWEGLPKAGPGAYLATPLPSTSPPPESGRYDSSKAFLEGELEPATLG